MTIGFVKKPDSAAVPVFLLKEKEKIERHPFFALLNKEDQKFILAFEEKSPIKDNHSHFVFLPSKREAVFLGAPAEEKWNHRKALNAARRAVAYARREKIKKIAINLEDFFSRDLKKLEELAEVIATQFELANFEFVKYKTPPKEGWFFIEQVQIFAEQSSISVKKALKSGKLIGEEINQARILSNTPGGDMTPQRLAEAALKCGRETGFKVKVLGEAEIRKLKMG